jgi:nucleoside-diphosphate-sugar epimerase
MDKLKILYIGAKGLAGKDFITNYGHEFEITAVDTDNITNIDGLLKNSYDWLICSIHSRFAKAGYLNSQLFNDHLIVVQKIFELAIKKVKHIIYFSSGSVYHPSSEPLKINDPLDYTSTNAYVKSKIMAEMLIMSYSLFFDKLFILRPFYIYGPDQNPNMLISGMIDKIRRKATIKIGKNGGLIFNPIFVSDVSFSLWFLINKYCGNGVQFFNVSGSEIVTLEEIISIIAFDFKCTPDIIVEDLNPVYSIGESDIIIENPTSVVAGISQMIYQ